MESFLVPALILLIVVAGVLTAVALSRKRSAGSRRPSPDAAERGQGPAPTREAAVAANARLDQQQHTAVYSMIARGHGLEAIQVYRKAAGVGLREAASAIASMSAYPQPYVSPGAGESGAAKPASSPAAEPSGGPDLPAEPAPGPPPASDSRNAAPEPERKDVAGHAAAEGHRADPPAPARPG